MTIPSLDIRYFPYDLTLGDRKVEVELGEWGSGTRNRTLVLLTIFRAKQVAESPASASKVTPVIVVEEPESFLHPSAQAEFGRVLQDLSEEFRVQIIVTTHSPYLLSQNRPESNILLKRRGARGQMRATERVDTAGDGWMEPFALALGIGDAEFKPWRELFFSKSSGLLLVEGDTDKEYFVLLRDPAHGSNRLILRERSLLMAEGTHLRTRLY
ncbi:MAG TPA: AAA family ATPase [Candidatus Eisenbacteria bacterium]